MKQKLEVEGVLFGLVIGKQGGILLDKIPEYFFNYGC